MTDYDEKYINMLKEIILPLVDTEVVMVFLFGSRVSGKHSSRADADIGLLSDDKLLDHLFHKIRNAVDESIIPWKVDIIDFTRVSSSFKEEALKEIIIWNKPRGMKIN